MMKLLQKIKNSENGLILETCVEYDDGTRHPKIGILNLEQHKESENIHRWIGLKILEWEILKELVKSNPEQYHMIIDLGPKDA